MRLSVLAALFLSGSAMAVPGVSLRRSSHTPATPSTRDFRQATRHDVIAQRNKPVRRAEPSGVPPDTDTSGSVDYELQSSGTAVTLNPTNPGLSVQEAVDQCTQLASNDADVYSSSNLYYLIAEDHFVCYQVRDRISDTSYMNLENSNVGDSYLYSNIVV